MATGPHPVKPRGQHIGTAYGTVVNYLFVATAEDPYPRGGAAVAPKRQESAMRLQIRTRGIESGKDLRGYVERRAGFALGRHDPRLGKVVVRISDVNGPRGGEDKLCQVVMEVKRGPVITIEDRDAAVTAAVDRALERASQAVSRAVDRERADLSPYPTHHPILAHAH